MYIYSWIFTVYGYPLQNVLECISLRGYQCEYPQLYGLLSIDIQKSWISMLTSVDFWKSMYGYAMDTDQGGAADDKATEGTHFKTPAKHIRSHIRKKLKSEKA